MKFYPLKEAEKNQEVLAAEYREAREIGVVKLGDTHLYFKKGR